MMTKLQELIGLVEQANKSKHWSYSAELLPSSFAKTEKVRICRYPVEGDLLVLNIEEQICEFTNINNQIEMSAICAKMRGFIKEDSEVISEDEIVQLRKMAWNHRKEGLPG